MKKGPESPLVEVLHVRPDASASTIQRGTILTVGNSSRGPVIFAVEDEVKARGLFDLTPADTAGAKLVDHPKEFGVGTVFVNEMDEPHRSRWQAVVEVQ